MRQFYLVVHSFQHQAWMNKSPLGFQQFPIYESHYSMGFIHYEATFVELSRFYKVNGTYLDFFSTYTTMFSAGEHMKNLTFPLKHSHNTPSCVVMIFVHLISPEWHHIACNISKLYQTVCFSRNHSHTKLPNNISQDRAACSKNFWKYKTKCFNVLWNSGTVGYLEFCMYFHLKTFPVHNENVIFLEETLSVSPIVLFLSTSPLTPQFFQKDRLLKTFVKISSIKSYVAAFQLCERSMEVYPAKQTYSNVEMEFI